MSSKEEIGRRVQHARKDAGLTQGELGRLWGGKSHAAVSDVERGATSVTASSLAELSNILDKPVTYFYGEKPAAQYFRGGRDETGAVVDGKATSDFVRFLKQRKETDK